MPHTILSDCRLALCHRRACSPGFLDGMAQDVAPACVLERLSEAPNMHPAYRFAIPDRPEGNDPAVGAQA
jgi:hypothetical protein